MSEIRRIMVFAADIPYSKNAVRYGISLARKYDAELVVLHVEHDPFGAYGWNLPFLSFAEEYKSYLTEEKKALDRLIRFEATEGLRIRDMIREGRPVDTILKVIGEEKIDLLVVPAHEESRAEHFLFGRITEALIRALPCSILLMKSSEVG